MTDIFVDQKRQFGKIQPDIYGQFSEHLGRCIYDGLWVGKDSSIPNVNGIRQDVVEALKAIHVPVLRWPGGCFADEYHWRDGIGPQAARKRMVNNNWGGVTEDNQFGTHEFFELCRQLGCAAYINGNVGSGTVQEMQEWVEYMTASGSSTLTDERRDNGQVEPWTVKYFGVGNESWGCGGNMRASYYADQYRQYQTYVHQYGAVPLKKIAVGPSDMDLEWTDTMMAIAGAYMDGLSLHHYALPSTDWQHKGAATGFTEAEWYAQIQHAQDIDAMITRHSTIMDRYDPDKRVALIVDEWGTWDDVEPGSNPGFLYQQNTLRDAMVAAVTLHIFQHHVDRVKMANIAQMVNVLQAMLMTQGDQIVKTPTYHVFKMFLAHQGATAIDTGAVLPVHLSESVSRQADGSYLISLCNFDLTTAEAVQYHFAELTAPMVSGEILTAETMDAHNDFGQPDVVVPVPFTNAHVQDAVVSATIPPHSVVTLHVR